MKHDEAMDITVVTPTRNRAGLAADLVGWLRAECKFDGPVVLADQSDDRGENLLQLLQERNLTDNVTHVVDDGRGTSRGRNQGSRHVTTTWIMLLDDDNRPERGFFRALQPIMAANQWADAIEPGNCGESNWQEYLVDPLHVIRRRVEIQRHSARRRPDQHRDAGEWLSTAPWSPWSCIGIGLNSGNLLIRTDAYRRVGGFDERIRGLGDDREFGFRLWWYGYRVWSIANPVTFSGKSPTGGLRTRQRESLWQRLSRPAPDPGYLYYLLKCFPIASARAVWRSDIRRKLLRKPWRAPLTLLRGFTAWRRATRMRRDGEILMQPPEPRERVLAEERLSAPAP